MAEFEVITDLLPDNDSFLPRYLTVQLLALLAAVQTTAKSDENIPQSKNEFVLQFKKNQQLFTPLTASIFWRDNVTATLTANSQLINTTDKYNRSPLTFALANEDFVLADKLITSGANLFLEDKLVLEITLLSMIQRDETIIDRILAAPTDYDLSWVREYLEYLRSYVKGQPAEINTRFHEVLNPPIRRFGQVLDTLSYFNGLPSHYGFLSPSLNILGNHLQGYTNQFTEPTTQGFFSVISGSYAESQNLCKFHGNLPTNNTAAQKILAQIQNNISSNSKRVVLLFGGWSGNAVAIAFVNKFLIFSNLGVGGNQENGTQIFTINNPQAITQEFVDNFIKGLGAAADPNLILASIGDIVDPTPVYTIAQTLNAIDNCIFVNPRAVIQGILLVLYTFNKFNTVSSDNLKNSSGAVADLYNNYVNSLYKHSTDDLSKFMRNHELLQNKRIECCSLALDYINQHYKDQDALPRCIQLKNALEYVGLKDFYINNVDPAAKKAIQDFMIHEQEVTAIKVIEREYELAANQAQGG